MTKLELTLKEEDIFDYVFSRLEGLAHFEDITAITFKKKTKEIIVELRDDTSTNSFYTGAEWKTK